MLRSFRKNHRAFTLVELVMAVAIGVFILAASFLVLSNLFYASTAASLRHKVNKKFDIAQDMIRYEAVGSYYSMTRSNQPMSVAIYPEITIHATITDENPITKTRSATLVANYYLGRGANRQVETQTRTFEFGNSYAAGVGASIQIRFVKFGTTTGVPGIQVETEGEGTPTVGGYSGPDGRLVLFGVKESSANIRLDLNSFNAHCYFPNATGGTFQKSVFPTDPAATTQAGAAPVPFTDVEVHVPGSLSGIIRDAGDTSVTPRGVPNMNIRLYPIEVPQNTYPPLDTTIRNTVSQQGPPIQGKFEIHGLLPGKYYLVVQGGTWNSESWCAVDVPGSTNHNALRNPTFWNGEAFPGVHMINSDQNTDVGVIYTIRKAAVTGRTRVLKADSPSNLNFTFPYNIVDAIRTPMIFFTDKSNTLTTSPIVGPTNYMWPGGSTFFWKDFTRFGYRHDYSYLGRDNFIINNTQYGYLFPTSDSSGNYNSSNEWPVIVYPQIGNPPSNPSVTNPMSNQYYWAKAFSEEMPNASIASPVRVAFVGASANINFMIRTRTWNEQYLPIGTSESVFYFPVFTNGNVPGNSRDIFFLERSNQTFATMTGDVITQNAQASYWQDAYIQSIFSNTPPTGSGLLRYLPATNSWVMEANHRMALTNTFPGNNAIYRFSLMDNGQNMIVPNAVDSQQFVLSFVSNEQNTNSNFNSNVLGWAKLSANTTFFTLLDPSLVNLGQVNFHARAVGNPLHEFTTSVGVNGGFLNLINATTKKREERTLLTQAHTFLVGETFAHPTITVPEGPQTLRDYQVTLGVQSNTTDGWSYVPSTWDDFRIFVGAFTNPGLTQATFQPLNPTSQDPHFIPTFLVQNYIQVRGNVRRLDNNAVLPNAQVRISGLGLPARTIATDASGNFNFTPGSNYIVVDPALGVDNIVVRVEGPAGSDLLPVNYSTSTYQALPGAAHGRSYTINYFLSPGSGGFGGSF